MKIKWFVFFALAANVAPLLYANDSQVSGRGDTIHPVQSTDIQLADEKLNIAYENGRCHVSVKYLFHNKKETQTVPVAFISYAYSPEISIAELENFTTIANGKTIPYKTVKKENTNEIGNVEADLFYYFDITFLKGNNTVTHSYSYRGSDSAGEFGPGGCGYTLLTGNNWRGNIKNIEIIIQIPENSIIYYLSDFINIDGQYKEYYPYKYHPDKKVVFFKEGRLFFSAENYTITNDIYFSIFTGRHMYDEFKIFEQYDITLGDILFQDISAQEDRFTEWSKSDLRILRNGIFAWYGYSFSSPDLRDFFNSQPWYFENEKEKIELTGVQRKNVDFLHQMEKQ